jgi:hypothetical protein
MIGKICALLLSVAMGCEVTQSFAAQMAKPEPIDYSRDVGLFAADRQGRFCLSIKNAALQRGQQMTLIWVSAEEVPSRPEIRYATIEAKLAAPCDPVNFDADNATYELAADKFDRGRVYIALVGRHADLRITKGGVTGRLGASDDIAFRSCASMEGLHFFLSAVSRSKAKKVWHEYYYVGYDLEPNCKDADLRD